MVCVLAACHRYGVCTVCCVECDWFKGLSVCLSAHSASLQYFIPVLLIWRLVVSYTWLNLCKHFEVMSWWHDIKTNSCLLLTAEAWVWSQHIACGMYGGLSFTGTCFWFSVSTIDFLSHRSFYHYPLFILSCLLLMMYTPDSDVAINTAWTRWAMYIHVCITIYPLEKQ